MDKIKVIFTIELENGIVRDFTINDISPGASDAEIITVGADLITKGCEYKGSAFKKVLKTKKITSSEEIL